MFKIDHITKQWKEAGSLHAHINLYGFWDEHAFLTKSGDLGVAFKIGGVDYKTSTAQRRDYAVKRLEAAFRTLNKKPGSIRSCSSATVPRFHQIPMRIHFSMLPLRNGGLSSNQRPIGCSASRCSGFSCLKVVTPRPDCCPPYRSWRTRETTCVS